MVHQANQSAAIRAADGDAGNQAGSVDAPRAKARHQSAALSAPLLLSEKQAAALYGVSVRKFFELRVAGLVSEPIVLGPRLLRWPRAEIEAAIAGMPRQRLAGAEPLHLAKGRAASRGRTEIRL